MLNRNVDFRVEAASLAAECRQLRLEHRRARNRARRLKVQQRHAEASLTLLEREALRIERMAARRASRLHHLTRMILKDTPYHTVEALTYEAVNPAELHAVCEQWEPSISEEYVEGWLKDA